MLKRGPTSEQHDNESNKKTKMNGLFIFKSINGKEFTQNEFMDGLFKDVDPDIIQLFVEGNLVKNETKLKKALENVNTQSKEQLSLIVNQKDVVPSLFMLAAAHGDEDAFYALRKENGSYIKYISPEDHVTILAMSIKLGNLSACINCIDHSEKTVYNGEYFGFIDKIFPNNKNEYSPPRLRINGLTDSISILQIKDAMKNAEESGYIGIHRYLQSVLAPKEEILNCKLFNFSSLTDPKQKEMLNSFLMRKLGKQTQNLTEVKNDKSAGMCIIF